jgi:hypothetical protein
VRKSSTANGGSDIIGHGCIYNRLNCAAAICWCSSFCSCLEVICHFRIEFFCSLLSACTRSLTATTLGLATSSLASSSLLRLVVSGRSWLCSVLGLTGFIRIEKIRNIQVCDLRDTIRELLSLWRRWCISAIYDDLDLDCVLVLYVCDLQRFISTFMGRPSTLMLLSSL